MAYNERLAERVRGLFAGRAFLLDGKMCVGVLNDELVVRAGAERYAVALKEGHARPMDFTGRPMTGMVYVSPAGVSRGPSLRRWVELGIAGAEGATPGRRRRTAVPSKASNASKPSKK